MHGFARDLPFEPHADVLGAGLRMVLRDSEATRTGYPFGFRFQATYNLVDARTLDVTLSTENTGNARLPYYAGHHFYFNLRHAQRSEYALESPRTERRYQQALTARSALPSRASRAICWTMPAFMTVSIASMRAGAARAHRRCRGSNRLITIDLRRPDSVPWYAVTTWTETPESDFYCVEPWLGLPDAIHNGMGLRSARAGPPRNGCAAHQRQRAALIPRLPPRSRGVSPRLRGGRAPCSPFFG